MMSFLYRIAHHESGLVYIGKSNNPQQRWASHRSVAKHKSSDCALTHALNKYGIDNFVFEVIGEYESEDEAFAAEVRVIAEHREKGSRIINQDAGGRGGYTQGDDHKQKIGAAQRAAWSDSEKRKNRLEKRTPECLKSMGHSHESHHNAKLNWDLVDEIRAVYGDGSAMTIRDLSKKYTCVSYPTLHKVVTFRSWIRT